MTTFPSHATHRYQFNRIEEEFDGYDRHYDVVLFRCPLCGAETGRMRRHFEPDWYAGESITVTNDMCPAEWTWDKTRRKWTRETAPDWSV